MQPNKKTVLSRIKAFSIDYLIILAYIIILFGATLLLSRLFDLNLANVGPLAAEAVGFSTLTLPVILYFTISETKYAATTGKKKFGLRVVSVDNSPASSRKLLARNIFKFLPWEIAHFFIYQLFYFSSKGLEPPAWVMIGLIFAQGLALMYVLLVFLTKTNRSVYEWMSGTKVVNGNYQ